MDRNKRHTLLTIGAVGLGYVGLRFAPSLIPKVLTLEDLDRPAGFRRYTAGKSSAGAVDPFLGLQTDDSSANRESENRAYARVQDNICGALYAGLDLESGQVPLASFSDYYCPICRVQTKQLAEYHKNNKGLVAIAWHELPIFGEKSNAAARAALAAKRQGKYAEFHIRLMKTPFIPSDEYLSILSNDLGLNEARFFEDMNGQAVTRELENSKALSRIFAFAGTPALVVGRTVIQGLVSEKMLGRIIGLEREEGWANGLC